MNNARPIRVLFLNSCINGGGAGRSLEPILQHPDPRLEATVALPAPGVLADRIGDAADLRYIPEFVERMKRSPYAWPDRLHIQWLHVPASVFALLRCIGKLTRLVEALQPDVIHCNHMLAKPIGAAVGVRTAVPVVFHSRACHQMWLDGKFYSWLGQRKSVHRIICNSSASAAVYRQRSSDKVTLIPDGIDIEHYRREAVTACLRREFNIGSTEFVVGFVGRIQASKGIEWLLRSFQLFSRNHGQVRLVVIGGNDGSSHKDSIALFKREAAGLGLADKVVFTGFRDDVRPYLKDLDVLVVPSVLPESFGRVTAEAMAFEIPVVVSAHGGSLEVVRDGQEGLWVEVNDVAGLSDAMSSLFTDPALRSKLGANGRKRVQACYGSEATTRRIRDVLIEVATQAKP